MGADQGLALQMERGPSPRVFEAPGDSVRCRMFEKGLLQLVSCSFG